MPTAISRQQWINYEKRSMKGQQEVVANYQDNFDMVPITEYSDLWVGDHLVDEGKVYSHHMLCTASYGKLVKVIHYTGPNLGGLGTFRGLSLKDFGVFGIIQEEVISVHELAKQKIQKIIWPRELRRFPIEEVIKRAKERVGEPYYDFLKNNCEHFVTWCMCGLKVSLQVKSWYITLRELVYSAAAGGRDCFTKIGGEKLVPLLVKIVANVSDEAALFMAKSSSYVAFGLGIAIESGLALYEIDKAVQQREEGILIKTDEQFYAKIVEIVAKALGRVSFGAAGSVIGAAVFPVAAPVGSLVGGAIGAFVGHFVGAIIGWVYENRSYIDG